MLRHARILFLVIENEVVNEQHPPSPNSVKSLFFLGTRSVPNIDVHDRSKPKRSSMNTDHGNDAFRAHGVTCMCVRAWVCVLSVCVCLCVS